MKNAACLLAATLGFGASSSAAQERVALTIENIQTRSRGAFDASIAPDGRWVAVTAATDQGRGIFLVPAEPGGAPPRLWVTGGAPSWFPGSRRIAYLAAGDVWIATIGDTLPARLTADAEDERAPAVSPDGSQVAFYSTRSGAQDIWVVPATGGAPRAPRWSRARSRGRRQPV